ncbi:MAG: dethiobiotin synthase [Nitrospirae bacterium]|nr:MAG: dethiobiotin synthase [Nitrospirota bacterium]
MLKGGYFITGTDTGVGKTLVAAALIRFLKHKGYSVCPLKPAETGCIQRDGTLLPQDGQILLEASEAEVSIKDVVPFRYKAPLAPMVASEQEGRPFSVTRFLKLYEELKDRFDYIIMEGAGGVMVPLTRDLLTIDLIDMVALPAVVVASNKLGVINHTLMTVEVLKRRGIPIAGVILNNPVQAPDDLSKKTNRLSLERLLPVPVLGEIPYLKKKDLQSLYEAFIRHVDTTHLL